jgi:predicted RNA-binding protein YlqC (UPF0109 family)
VVPIFDIHPNFSASLTFYVLSILSEPPAKQQKVSEDSKEDVGTTTEGDDKAAAPVDQKSDKTETDGGAEAKAEEETPEPKDAEKTAETEAAPTPAPVAAAVPAPAPATAPTVSSVPPPAVAAVSAMPPGLPPDFSASNPDAPVEEKGTVSALYVGRVIGKGGEMIRDLQARSSCRIDVDQNVPQGQPRVITYRGTRRTVDFAKKLVHMLCQENASETDLPLGEAKREFLIVPAQSVGKIIGRGGEMIRELQARSQAKIQVDHNSHNGMDQQKHVTMTGTVQAVTKAKEMILFLVANPLMDAMQSINLLVEDKLQRGGIWGSGPPYPNLPNMGQNMQPEGGGGGGGGGYGYDQQPSYGGHHQAAPAHQPYAAPPAAYAVAPPAYQQQAAQAPYGQFGAGGGSGGTETEVFHAAKNFMGRIIGSKGVTINDLQRRSGTDLQINQDVQPGRECEITIRGSRQGVETAKQMLREIIEIGPNHPYAGGGRKFQLGYRIVLKAIIISLPL